jgi:hypothetical protein
MAVSFELPLITGGLPEKVIPFAYNGVIEIITKRKPTIIDNLFILNMYNIILKKQSFLLFGGNFKYNFILNNYYIMRIIKNNK